MNISKIHADMEQYSLHPLWVSNSICPLCMDEQSRVCIAGNGFRGATGTTLVAIGHKLFHCHRNCASTYIRMNGTTGIDETILLLMHSKVLSNSEKTAIGHLYNSWNASESEIDARVKSLVDRAIAGQKLSYLIDALMARGLDNEEIHEMLADAVSDMASSGCVLANKALE